MLKFITAIALVTFGLWRTTVPTDATDALVYRERFICRSHSVIANHDNVYLYFFVGEWLFMEPQPEVQGQSPKVGDCKAVRWTDPTFAPLVPAGRYVYCDFPTLFREVWVYDDGRERWIAVGDHGRAKILGEITGWYGRPRLRTTNYCL